MVHRIASQLRYLFNVEALVAGWASGIAISLVSIFENVDWTRLLAPGWFSITLLLLMTIEILTCHFSNPPPIRKLFSWEKHIRNKLLIAAMVIVSLVLDSIIIAIILWMPVISAADLPAWGAGFLPITLSTLLWLNTAEAIRIVSNVAHSTGDENIPPIVLWVIRQLRRVDQARMPPGGYPQKRMLDNVTEEDIKMLLERMTERSMLDDPPPPLGSGDAPQDSDIDPIEEVSNGDVRLP